MSREPRYPASTPVARQNQSSASNSLFRNILDVSLLDPRFCSHRRLGIRSKSFNVNILCGVNQKKIEMSLGSEAAANSFACKILPVKSFISRFCGEEKPAPSVKLFRKNILQGWSEKCAEMLRVPGMCCPGIGSAR